MEACGAAGPIDHGRFQVVEDEGARTGPKELQGMHQAAIEFRLALREGELDIGHPAGAEYGHQDRDLAGRLSHLDTAALAPVDLHRLRRLVVDFLIDATVCGTD